MDYKELVGRLRTISDIFKAHTGMDNYIEDAATAITDLLARAEAAEAENTALRRMQPVRLDDTSAQALTLAAEVSELRKKLGAYEATGLEPEDLKKPFDEEVLLTMTARMMGITPDRLRELMEADREGRCVVQEYKPGDPVWVVERDEIEAPDCVSGYVFVAHANGAALVSAYLGDCGDVDAILADCIEETRETGECDIEVFPIEDCYHSIEDAESALKGEQNGD